MSCWPGLQEIEGEVRRHRERDRADARENRGIEREIGKRHHRGTRDRAAGPNMPLVIGHPHAREERPDLLEEIGLPAVMELRELAIKERDELVARHRGLRRHRTGARLSSRCRSTS